MRRGRSTMLLLGAVLALVAFFLLYLGLSNTPSRGEPLPPTAVPKEKILVAARDIPSYTIITTDDVTLQDMEVPQVVSGTTTLSNRVLGQVLTHDYAQGTQILLADVTQPGISQVLTTGLRAFELPIQEVDNFGGQLYDNDVVDVLWTRNFEVMQSVAGGANGQSQSLTKQLPTTKKILDNIKIVRVLHLTASAPQGSGSGNAPVNTSPQGSGNGNNDAATAAAAQTSANQALYAKDAAPTAVLILAMTDQQAEVLKFARENGTIDLALRAKGDYQTVERTTGITDKIMNEDYGVVLPEILIK